MVQHTDVVSKTGARHWRLELVHMPAGYLALDLVDQILSGTALSLLHRLPFPISHNTINNSLWEHMFRRGKVDCIKERYLVSIGEGMAGPALFNENKLRLRRVGGKHLVEETDGINVVLRHLLPKRRNKGKLKL